MKRIFDIWVATIGLTVLTLPMLAIALVVHLTSPGPVLYWSNRVGRSNQIFRMPKFRTMRTDAPVVATHLLKNSDQWLTPIGPFLRRWSLDELPQLWSVLLGQMTLVGPRPALFNQYDLITLRTNLGIHELVPGITGWAQINGRDSLLITQKVKLELEYLRKKSFLFDLKILWMTALKVLSKDGVLH